VTPRALKVGKSALQPASSDVERILLGAERSIRLLDRLTPSNYSSERARLLEMFGRGGASSPQFAYTAAPDFSDLRRQLDALATSLERGSAGSRLLADRARELDEEAAIVAAIDSGELPRLARARFASPSSDASDALCEQWLAEPPPPSAAELIASDDAAHPQSLLSRLRLWISERKLEIRVELRRELSSIAAAGDGFVALRPGVLLPAAEAERIALHELEAHVLPRLSARAERDPLFRVGCRNSAEHEEGRALLIEERFGLMSPLRRFELAARHRAARMARAGADFVEMVSSLDQSGVPLPQAIDYSSRVLRGGGLAREIVYIPAYLELRNAFGQCPQLERYFERGRVSLQGARMLSNHEAEQLGQS
jgi:hypothetical protein